MYKNNFMYVLNGLSFIILFLLYTNKVYGNSNKSSLQCIQNNYKCNYDPSSCCDLTSSCEFNKSVNEFVCSEKKVLGSSCINDEDCSDIAHAKCSPAKECVCRLNNLKINETRCAPTLRGFCWKNETCITDNTVCVENECRCRHNYVESGNQCVLNFLGQDCVNDENCYGLKNAKCSNAKCACIEYYGKYDSLTCLPHLETSCTKNEGCFVKNSECIDGKCQCDELYQPRSRNECLATVLKKSCKSDVDCQYESFSRCIKEKCTCTSDFIAVKETLCEPFLGHYCSPDHPCMLRNALCVNNECQCKPSFIEYSITQCVQVLLEGPCMTQNDCVLIKHAKCFRNKCICQDNYTAINATICASLLNGDCSVDTDCHVSNSVCIANQCQCSPSFTADISNTYCKKAVLGKYCSTSEDCSIILNSVCSSNNICVCSPKFFALGKHLCVPAFNAPCLIDEDCVSKTFNCVDYKCRCKPNFTSISIDRCVETHSLYSCKDTTECSDSWHWNCSTSGKCVCHVDNIAVTNVTCLPILNGACWRDDQCMAENSICQDFRCVCKPQYLPVADNFCVVAF